MPLSDDIRLKHLGNAIARQRKIAGLTQAQVAEALGLHTTTISRIENGSIMPSMARMSQLHDLFGCPYYYFFEVNVAEHERVFVPISDLVRLVPKEKRGTLVALMGSLADLLQ